MTILLVAYILAIAPEPTPPVACKQIPIERATVIWWTMSLYSELNSQNGTRLSKSDLRRWLRDFAQDKWDADPIERPIYLGCIASLVQWQPTATEYPFSIAPAPIRNLLEKMRLSILQTFANTTVITGKPPRLRSAELDKYMEFREPQIDTASAGSGECPPWRLGEIGAIPSTFRRKGRSVGTIDFFELTPANRGLEKQDVLIGPQTIESSVPSSHTATVEIILSPSEDQLCMNRPGGCKDECLRVIFSGLPTQSLSAGSAITFSGVFEVAGTVQREPGVPVFVFRPLAIPENWSKELGIHPGSIR